MIGISGIVMDYVDTANTSMRGMMVSHSALLELLFPGKVCGNSEGLVLNLPQACTYFLIKDLAKLHINLTPSYVY
jgi:hypothetical protein